MVLGTVPCALNKLSKEESETASPKYFPDCFISSSRLQCPIWWYDQRSMGLEVNILRCGPPSYIYLTLLNLSLPIYKMGLYRPSRVVKIQLHNLNEACWDNPSTYRH